MRLGEHIPVLPEGLGHLVDGLLVHICVDEQGELDRGSRHILVLPRIGSGRDGVARVPRIILLERLDGLRGNRQNLRVGGGHNLGDGRVRRARHDPNAVELLVADRVGGFARAHVFGLEVIERLAQQREMHRRLINGRRTGRADGDVLADQILQRLDAAVAGHDHLIRVVIQPRENAQVFVRIAFKAVRALPRLIDEVRVGDADLRLAVQRLIQVVNAAAGGRGGRAHALDAVVPQLADGRADRVERGGRARGDEVDVRGKRARGAHRSGRAERGGKPFFHSRILLYAFCLSGTPIASFGVGINGSGSRPRRPSAASGAGPSGAPRGRSRPPPR